MDPKELAKEYAKARLWLDEMKHRDALVVIQLAELLAENFGVDRRMALVQVRAMMEANKS